MQGLFTNDLSSTCADVCLWR